MCDEEAPHAKREEGKIGQYVCDECSGWTTGALFSTFLDWIDHKIDHLCRSQHPKLSRPMMVDDRIWYRLPDKDQIIPGLPSYEPNSPEWNKILDKKEKILPQAAVFLPYVAAWLANALRCIEELNSIATSDLFAAEKVVKLVQSLPDEFSEQRDYLLSHEQLLRDTAMDPKWSRRAGQQALFIAKSMAGARWGLTPSTSREMIRKLVARRI